MTERAAAPRLVQGFCTRMLAIAALSAIAAASAQPARTQTTPAPTPTPPAAVRATAPPSGSAPAPGDQLSASATTTATPVLTPAGAVPASVAPSTAAAQPTTAAAAPAPDATNLDDVQRTVTQLQTQAKTAKGEDRLVALRNQSAISQAAADKVVNTRSKEMALLDAQLKRLAPPKDHRPESAERRRQRDLLLARRGALQRQIDQAESVGAAASHTYDLVAERRRDAFTARVFRRTASPVSPAFWSSLADAADLDVDRFVAVAREGGSVAARAREPQALGALALALLAAAALVFPARRMLEKLSLRRRGERATRTTFPMTAHALWIAVVDTLAPAMAATALHVGAQWGGLLSEKGNVLASAGVVAVTWGAAVVALGRATVTSRDPSNRLLTNPEESVRRLRIYLRIVALITGAGLLLTRLNDVIGASPAFTVAANSALALAYAGIAGLFLVGFGRDLPPVEEVRSADEARRSSTWTLVSLVLTLAILVTLGAVFAGYSTLAVLISSQIFWLSLLLSVTYLLLRVADDLCQVLFHGKGWAATTLFSLFNLRVSTIGQIGVLVSAGLQVVILLGALSLALTPFGQSGSVLATHLNQLGASFHIGSAVISPRAVAAGLGCLAIGLGLVHLVRNWVEQRYLPVTGWDAGVRNSVGTGVGYIGVAVTLLCALSALGLGFQQIALVASALSVGIGFGLQQVVQNFVSGLILLVERPVKVGDWISVAGVEGDVHSIRVRATEIRMLDRTTQIVPNSDLITKTVQNKTRGDPHGRVQLQFSIANPGDARRTSDLVQAVAKGRSEVLDDPGPVVFIDSIASSGAVNLNCFLYVETQRDVYKVRSAVFFDLLEALQHEGIALVGSTPQNLVLEPGAKMQDLLDTAARLTARPAESDAGGR